ncbi:phage holin family protein [Ruegeria meonggei]|uniref:Holin-X, holin superfamily III n=1 Tax=Ruegeria meonggei TaxID=1446476 RepID=A0A1X6Z0I0_9RHOB|nr:phage holin family protein [Ruegeria meonggei]SLN36848.1 hypothetical protein RUM8411_01589 [Ruegeria meonggei]
MSRISRNISIILRAERLIAQRHLTIAAKRTGFYAAAGLAVGLAVVMLNIAGFFWLSVTLSKPLAALIVAAANLLLAVILALLANAQSPQADTTAAVELRDMALNDIEAEIKDSLSDARDTVAGIRRDPIGTLTPEVFSAILSTLIKYARRRKE